MIFSSTIHLLSSENIDLFVKKILPYFLALVFVTTAVGAFSGYLTHNNFKIGDWLINYQGGMIRRGLLGEFIYKLSTFTNISPGIYAVIFQIIFYGIFFIFSYALLKRQRSLLPFAFLVFSPFIFAFHLNDLQGGYRKEIMFFAILAFTVWSAKKFEYKSFKIIFYLTIGFFPAVILTHEIAAVYLPYLMIVYLSVVDLSKGRFFIITLLLLPSVASFAASIYFSGTAAQVTEIFASIAKEGYALQGGAIEALSISTTSRIERVVYFVKNENYFSKYIIVTLLSFIAYIPLHENIKIIFQKRLSIILFLITIFGTIVLFAVALDWGRFIYIHLVSLFLLSLMRSNEHSIIFSIFEEYAPNKNGNKSNNFNVLALSILFVVYTLFWRVPHCCSEIPFTHSITTINGISWLKPYAEIFLKYSN